MKTEVVFIGKKPFMNYVSAIIMQFQPSSGIEQVTIKARGNLTCRAIDIAMTITKRNMVGVVELKDVRLDSEKIKSENNKIANVSSIEIDIGYII